MLAHAMRLSRYVPVLEAALLYWAADAEESPGWKMWEMFQFETSLSHAQAVRHYMLVFASVARVKLSLRQNTCIGSAAYGRSVATRGRKTSCA